VEAEYRFEIGHWEGDSLVSRKSLAALNSLTERKSRLLLLTKINRKTAQETTDVVVGRFVEMPEAMRKTLTMDNGTENAGHEDIYCTPSRIANYLTFSMMHGKMF